MVDFADPLQVQLEAHIRKSLGASLFPVSIPLDPVVGEGLMQDRPAVLYRPEAPSAWSYRQLTQFILAAETAKVG